MGVIEESTERCNLTSHEVYKKCRIKLSIVRSGYRIYPLVSNSVDIDFTELGPPQGTKPAQVPSKGQRVDMTTIGFRVKPREKAIVQDYVNRLYNQFVVDPNTNEPKRRLDYPSSELVTRLVTFSYNSI
ncbi:MAG: hypothetical protein M3Y53_09090 [Thermoproteota archaeon]|nr:hypothetical protein [Thermoproteota archaeon]